MFVHTLDAIAAAYAISFLSVDTLSIAPIINRTKRKAATIQELFDCDVLQIPISPLKVAKDVTVEEVLTNYDAHSKIASNVEKVKDWYPVNIGQININVARLICQRTNCWWDSKLRTRYCSFIKGFSIAIPIIIIGVGVVKDLKFESIILIASALVPFFQFCAKEYSDNIDARERLDKLHAYITNLWDKIIDKTIEESLLVNHSRSIQDELYENRSKSPLILDSIYKKFRKKDETLMDKTAEILIKEIQDASVV